MSARTDCHRPGAIVPRDYSYRLSYAIPGTDDPGFNMALVRSACEAAGWGRVVRIFGHVGKCGVCGASFRYGDLWEHAPTGHLVHLGHECADKYGLLADRADFFAEIESLKKGRRAAIQAKLNTEKREAFLARHPGLREALETDHYIVKDLAFSLKRYNELTDKQVALALKLAREDAERRARPPEKHVAAPSGKVVVRGVVVSKKSYDGPYGSSLKMSVKVETPEGSWLAWGTVPSSIALDYAASGDGVRVEVGDEVEFSATLSPGRDAHFALFKRPTKARIVARKAAPAAA